jgi:hypothetical protein
MIWSARGQEHVVTGPNNVYTYPDAPWRLGTVRGLCMLVKSHSRHTLQKVVQGTTAPGPGVIIWPDLLTALWKTTNGSAAAERTSLLKC